MGLDAADLEPGHEGPVRVECRRSRPSGTPDETDREDMRADPVFGLMLWLAGRLGREAWTGSRLGGGISAQALADDLLGQPVAKRDRSAGRRVSQPQARADRLPQFHPQLPIIIAISLLVLAPAAVLHRQLQQARQSDARRPGATIPRSRCSGPCGPVLILMFIAIFSFRLLFEDHDIPKPDLTVKVTGRQWYWGYEYPGPRKIAEAFIANAHERGGRPRPRTSPICWRPITPLVAPVHTPGGAPAGHRPRT